ncbi:unnamed protein product [Paramecium pentaurelia]|uniref:Transmembrane protein n=1 Tax=Paramecium pentaurelia TaxID=43138 RepID=A0A8S1SRP6_9CILI|nr:unnamed protein product [Paramecium pentaurelia]
MAIFYWIRNLSYEIEIVQLAMAIQKMSYLQIQLFQQLMLLESWILWIHAQFKQYFENVFNYSLWQLIYLILLLLLLNTLPAKGIQGFSEIKTGLLNVIKLAQFTQVVIKNFNKFQRIGDVCVAKNNFENEDTVFISFCYYWGNHIKVANMRIVKRKIQQWK